MRGWSIINRIAVIILLVIHFSGKVFPQTSITENPNSKSRQFFSKAIVIGISEYQNRKGLIFADSDAYNVVNYLLSTSLDSSSIFMLTNKEATSANILNTLEYVKEISSANDHLLIYFSGHGNIDHSSQSDVNQLLCYDCPINFINAGGSISIHQLRSYAYNLIDAKNSGVMLVIDACIPNESIPDNSSNPSSHSHPEKYSEFLSSHPGEISTEGNKQDSGGGIFTHFFLEGLIGAADRNTDNKITVKELSEYLYKSVPSATQFMQSPQISGNMNQVVASTDKLEPMDFNQASKSFHPSSLNFKGLSDSRKLLFNKEIYDKYKLFTECIKKEKLVPDNTQGINALDIYIDLKGKDNAKFIIKHMKNTLLAALLNKSQIGLNRHLDGKDPIKGFTLKEIKIEHDYAFKLIEKTHVLFNQTMAKQIFFKSFSLLINDNYEDAIFLLKIGLQYDPTADYLMWVIGNTYDDLDNYDSSNYYYQKALDISPESPIILNDFATTNVRQGKYQKAADLLNKGLVISPGRRSLNYNLGYTYYKMERYDDAIECFKKSLLIAPDDALAYKLMGQARYAAGDTTIALKSLKKSYSLDPKNAKVSYLIADIYSDLNKFDSAITYFNTYIELNPNNASAYYYKGRCYDLMELYEPAIKLYEKAIKLDPSLIKPYISIAVINALAFQKYRKSIKTLNKAYDIEPENPEIQRIYGYIYMYYGEYSKSLDAFNTALSMNPDDPTHSYSLCSYYAYTGNVLESISWLEQALKLGFNNIESLKSDPDMENILSTEEFRNLIKKYID